MKTSEVTPKQMETKRTPRKSKCHHHIVLVHNYFVGWQTTQACTVRDSKTSCWKTSLTEPSWTVDLNSHLPCSKNAFHMPWWARTLFARRSRAEARQLSSFFPCSISSTRTRNHAPSSFYAIPGNWLIRSKMSVIDSPSICPKFARRFSLEEFPFRRILRSWRDQIHHILWSVRQGVSCNWWRTRPWTLITCRSLSSMSATKCLTRQVRILLSFICLLSVGKNNQVF